MPSAPKRHICVIPGATSRSINEEFIFHFNYPFGAPAFGQTVHWTLPTYGAIDFSTIVHLQQ
jgi:hypothetical protein